MALILASGSPRRRELMSLITPDYTVITSDVDETKIAADSPAHLAKALATAKARAVAEEHPDDIVCGFDTVVECEGEVFGKPKDEAEAKDMLRRLSGRTHQVITGVTLVTAGKKKTFATVSEVTFDELSDEEIAYYVAHYRPLDKAGAYGIQEWIGYAAIERIDGSFFNVMGLPIQRVYTELNQFIQSIKNNP